MKSVLSLLVATFSAVALGASPSSANAANASAPTKKEVYVDHPTAAVVNDLWKPPAAPAGDKYAPSPDPDAGSDYGPTRDIDKQHMSWTEHAPARAAEAPVQISQGVAVEFELGSARVRSADVDKVRLYADALVSNPNRRLLVVGHTDSTGPRSTNLPLSKKRADTVRRLLLNLGVRDEQVDSDGKGSEDPIPDYADNDRHQRRVEFVGLQP